MPPPSQVRGSVLVAAVARRIALGGGRPAPTERLADDLGAPVEELLVELAELESSRRIFRSGDGWLLRATPHRPDITPLAMAARLHRDGR